jgi:nitrite reductase (NADH) large subunit
MYGDTADSNWFFGLIRDKTDISDMRDTCQSFRLGRWDP